MSAFNILTADASCPSCGKTARFDIQFKYGNTWQLRYSIGDALKWGGNDVGEPGHKKVVAEGAAGPCPHCRAEHLDFAVRIEDDRIASVEPSSAAADSREGFIIEEA